MMGNIEVIIHHSKDHQDGTRLSHDIGPPTSHLTSVFVLMYLPNAHLDDMLSKYMEMYIYMSE